MSGVVHSVGNFFHNVGQLFSTPQAPTLQAPTALSATPTQTQGVAAASKKTLEQESAAASTSSILTGGQGLLDGPSTTSASLLGS